MNREIKFRAWFVEETKLLQVRELYQSEDSGVYAVQVIREDESGAQYWYTLAPSRFILMQFTGLKDKNGKEIYEGDIVRIRHEEDMHEHEEEGCEKGCTFGDDAWKTIEVKWDSEIAGYFFDSEALFGHEYILPIVTEGYETEIIGNIYENPELLK